MSKDKETPTPKTVNIATTNKPVAAGMPVLNLSMSDKLYLAVSRHSANSLHYVYSLFCAQDRPGTYNMRPETEIATFTDATAANIYYNTINEIIAYHTNGKAYEAIRTFTDAYVQDFNQRTR